jgi:hypothetical protein
MAMNNMNHKRETNKVITPRKKKEVDNDDEWKTIAKNQQGNCD